MRRYLTLHAASCGEVGGLGGGVSIRKSQKAIVAFFAPKEMGKGITHVTLAA
jgi:hypothetical protein